MPLCGALAEDLNGYLKSLRNKRKKNRKSSAKRAREKGRSRKSEYLALDWGRETSLKNNLKSLRESQGNDQKCKKESGGQGGVCTCVCVCPCEPRLVRGSRFNCQCCLFGHRTIAFLLSYKESVTMSSSSIGPCLCS